MLSDATKNLKKLQGISDPRSTRGMLSRGRNVYKGGSPSAKPVRLQEAARKRLRGVK